MIGILPTIAASLLWLVVGIVSLFLCALYDGTETGIYSLNKVRLELRCESGFKPALILKEMLRDTGNLLSVLLLGANITTYLVTFAVSTLFLMAGCSEWAAEWYTLVVATALLFVLAESVPKNIFQRNAETLVFRTVRLVKISDRLFHACGLSALAAKFARLITWPVRRRGGEALPMRHAGLAAIMAEGRASGLLTHFQSIMADRITQLAKVMLQHVMVPMRSVVSVPLDIAGADLIKIIQKHDYARLPVLNKDGQVVGILDIFDVLQRPGAVAWDKLAEPFVLSSQTSVTDALYQMQKAQQVMAIVIDSRQRHLGIVTVKDLVEEIVGELEAW